ncbi:M28 family metallopeptidase [Simiduia agarivorans]|uniref:Peptidase M28 n=1 Tax=Simiduia agarivorans (strain DSM 21679 / JCM 13881 / BCRC 17597 / SA1) TaxID=1117647 RepID=K4KHT7_SIMAS|nr:M28 family metallopeptidase [Simiduia agarivorans]AFU97538.1 peptidase M28 [Simiduia agarivorans SA1 = DSM 21679]
MKLRLWAALAMSALGLVACDRAEQAESGDRPVDARAAQVQQFADRLHQHVAVLASDEFEGRAPATPGEEKTVNYLAQEFAKLGLVPGNDGSWFQNVPVVASTLTNTPVLNLTAGEQTLALQYGTDMMAWTKRETESAGLADSELVFVGYGIVAPEYNWNDYRDLDVKGKTVVVLVNDPGYATQDDNLFTGNAMTYYGRWTYKYEEAARQGASGVLIVHETGAAGYPWEVVSGSWSGDQISLASDSKGAERVAVEGWLHNDQARKLFAMVGQDFDALVKAAASAEFKPVPLAASASIRLENELRYSESRNVVALVPGHKRSDEVVIYTAHWDHLGKKPGAEGEDHIFNGAVDNATGTSALLGLAEAFMAVEQSLQRSVLFVAVTAEESGLLGSAYYAQNPVFAAYKTVGGINMDAMNVNGPTRDVVVIGYGASEMDDLLKAAADKQQRTLVREPTPEKGFFYRSDHFNLAKVGVPMLYAKGGNDNRDHGHDYGKAQAADYGAHRYHKPADEYDPEWNLLGAAEDMQLYYDIGYRLATGAEYPKWRATSEFNAPRASSIEACKAAGETRCPQ